MIHRTISAHVGGWLFALASLAGCSATGNDSNPLPGDGNGGGTGGTGGTIATGGTIPTNGGTGMRDPNDTRDLPVRKKMCDATGQNCTCLRLALLGTLASAAVDKDTTAFVSWLNGNSDGTATATMVTTKPALDAAYLAGFDILVVANVNGWSFSAAEKDAVHTWMMTTGGGLVSLTGFDSMSGEPAATSQLIEAAGFSYTLTPAATAVGQEQPVYFEGGTTNLKNCLWWTGAGTQAGVTTPIPFVKQLGNMEKLTFELDYVGAFIGWGVAAPAGATVVATDPVSGQPMATALELEGKGRLLAFGDEWIVFRNQWEPTGNAPNMQMDMYNPCWHQGATADDTYFHSVKTLYQTKQFWYNAVNWAAPPNECGFTITDPDVVVVK